MSDLADLAFAIMGSATLAGIFGLLPLSMGMKLKAESHNSHERNKFLRNYFRSFEVYDSYIKNGFLCTPINSEGVNYVLLSEHKKSSWFADLFYDTRLYAPVKFVKNSNL